jgi:hypothetical protein
MDTSLLAVATSSLAATLQRQMEEANKIQCLLPGNKCSRQTQFYMSREHVNANQDPAIRLPAHQNHQRRRTSL